MSMICNLRRVSPSEINRLLEVPEHITSFLYGEELAAPAPSGGGFLSGLFGRRKPAPKPLTQWPPRPPGDEIDLDKAWHALHFLFTGTEWEGQEPACYLVKGGHQIGDVDVGYGPARALMPDQVQRFADYLQSLTTEELQRRYDPGRMTELEIYPDIWKRAADAGESEFGYVLGGFETLREFVLATRDASDGVVIYLN